MNQEQDSNKNKTGLMEPTIFMATWLGSGLLPKVPGTWGSLASLPFAWFLHLNTSWEVLAGACLIIFLIGIWAANGYKKLLGGKDPGPIVIDEVAGMWLTLLPAIYLFPKTPDLFTYFVAFLLFRICDICKPWPASLADKKLSGGIGIMLDDIIAAIYSGLGLTCYLMYTGV